MKIIEKFTDISTDLSPIGLLEHEGGYFCTPENSVTFAGVGVDGIHFCIIPNENDLTLESSPVYVVNPMNFDHYVEIVAENFYDFISLVIEIKDAGALEWVSYMTREEVAKSLHSIPDWALQYYDAERANKEKEIAITDLSKAFKDNIKNIDDVYGYVKKLQKETDLTKIQYTNEYYKATGRTK